MNILNKSDELIRLIDEASIVFLMAHRDLDLDAINSCAAMDFYVKRKHKKSYIIIDDVNQELGVKKVLDLLNHDVRIIRSNRVKELRDDDSLLIILDTSKAKLVQNENIIASFDRVINIDHHDKSKDNIRCQLSIVDEDTSSTCEMMTTFFKDNGVKITSKIATLLLAGIVLDTNNYKLKTSADSFYISYYLVKCGAKMNDVNELLKQDIRDYVKRQKIISSVKVIKDIAIGRGLQRNEYKKEELAKTADSLLTFSRIRASFVVAKIARDVVGISARSTGEIDVGKILENFGGGGGESEAAAVIEEGNVNKIIEELLKMIKSL